MRKLALLLALLATTAQAQTPRGLLGSYCVALRTGTMAAGALTNAPIASFRYGGANLALVRRITFDMGVGANGFSAGTLAFDLFVARNFTASDSGGNAADLSVNNGKLRTSFSTSAVADFRISSTAALTPGTRTLDGTAIGTIFDVIGTGSNQEIISDSFLFASDLALSPFILATNEGFVIQATVPATGTWAAKVRVCWDEAQAYP